MKAILSLAYASSAACFGIILSLGPESAFWMQHPITSKLLGAGIPLGFVAAFFVENDLFQKPGTLGHRVTCVIAILVSLSGIFGFLLQFGSGISAGFAVGVMFLLALLVGDWKEWALKAIERKGTDGHQGKS